MATEISYSTSSSQYAFVRQDLLSASQNQNIHWIIVYFYKPMYSSPSSCSSCSGESSLRDTYHPLFDQFGVDLVLEGHTHDYQRSFPIKFNINSKSNPSITDTNKNNYIFPANPSSTHGQIHSIVGTAGVNFHSLKTPLKPYFVYGQSKEFGFLNIDIQNNGQTLVGKFLSNERSPSTSMDQFTITKLGSSPQPSPPTCPSEEHLENGVCVPNSPSSGYHYAPFKTVNDAKDIVDQQDKQELRLTKFSIAAWFRTTIVPSDEGFTANKGGTGVESSGKNLNFGLWLTSTGKLSGGFETSSGTDIYVKSPNSYVNGQWQHGTVTFDGSNVRLYVNGIQVASASTTSVPDTKGNQPLRIGANSLSITDIFKGDIDEVGVWSKALNSSEIANLMNNGIVPSGSVYRNTFG